MWNFEWRVGMAVYRDAQLHTVFVYSQLLLVHCEEHTEETLVSPLLVGPPYPALGVTSPRYSSGVWLLSPAMLLLDWTGVLTTWKGASPPPLTLENSVMRTSFHRCLHMYNSISSMDLGCGGGIVRVCLRPPLIRSSEGDISYTLWVWLWWLGLGLAPTANSPGSSL